MGNDTGESISLEVNDPILGKENFLPVDETKNIVSLLLNLENITVGKLQYFLALFEPELIASTQVLRAVLSKSSNFKESIDILTWDCFSGLEITQGLIFYVGRFIENLEQCKILSSLTRVVYSNEMKNNLLSLFIKKSNSAYEALQILEWEIFRGLNITEKTKRRISKRSNTTEEYHFIKDKLGLKHDSILYFHLLLKLGKRQNAEYLLERLKSSGKNVRVLELVFRFVFSGDKKSLKSDIILAIQEIGEVRGINNHILIYMLETLSPGFAKSISITLNPKRMDFVRENDFVNFINTQVDVSHYSDGGVANMFELGAYPSNEETRKSLGINPGIYGC